MMTSLPKTLTAALLLAVFLMAGCGSVGTTSQTPPVTPPPRVDAFGIKLAMRLHCADSFEATVGENPATFAEDRAMGSRFPKQGRMEAAWGLTLISPPR